MFCTWERQREQAKRSVELQVEKEGLEGTGLAM